MTQEIDLSDTELAAARGHVASMSNSAAKTIAALQTHAQTAREAKDDAARRAFIAKSHDVADEMAAIQLAYYRLRTRRSLNDDIEELKSIAAEARSEAERVQALAEALEAAGEVVSRLTRLALLVV